MAWDPLVEEEWYESKVVKIQAEYHNHENWCPTCDWDASCFCRKGQHIIDQLTAMQRNLSMVRLKNKLG